MADNDICNKIVAALSDSSTNVKKLRKQILLQLQTDSDDKVAKKKFNPVDPERLTPSQRKAPKQILKFQRRK